MAAGFVRTSAADAQLAQLGVPAPLQFRPQPAIKQHRLPGIKPRGKGRMHNRLDDDGHRRECQEWNAEPLTNTISSRTHGA